MRVIRCAADREAGDYIVLVSDEGKIRFDIRKSEFKIKIGDVVDVHTEEDKIIKIDVVPGESERRLSESKRKLNALFNRSKKG
jgi:ribosomal 50S subunit-recycling heat shock protein